MSTDDVQATIEEESLTITVPDEQQLSMQVIDSDSLVAHVQPQIPVIANIASPEEIISVTVEAVGPAGGEGPRGPAGPPGDSNEALGYVHTQLAPSDEWVINHSLAFLPNVTVTDSAGTSFEGDVHYLGQYTVIINFSAAFSGTAILS